MSVRVFRAPEELARAAGDAIHQALQAALAARGRATLALAGGTTPRAAYAVLARLPLDWTRVEIFFGDERAVPASHAESNYHMACIELVDRLTVAPAAVHRMEADAPDVAAAARTYAAQLPDAFDVLVLGVGPDGHTASLFPGAGALGATDRVVAVVGPKPPPQRLTITPPVIAAARQVIVLAAGADKAAAVARALEGPLDVMTTPAQLARGGSWLLDGAAAAALRPVVAGSGAVDSGAAGPTLVGDIGGTKVLLALASRGPDGRLVLSQETRYRSDDWEGLEPVVHDFLGRTGAVPSRAAFGLAGPVIDERWSAPNLTWTLHRPTLERTLGVPVVLLNDFEAAGWGLAELAPEDLAVLQEGIPVERGPRGLIGAGTGLGQALLSWQGDGYIPIPTEGGHGEFAARSDREWRLRQFVAQRVGGRVSVERIVAGPGIPLIYEFLRDESAAPESDAVRAEMAGPDPAAVVSRHAALGDDRLCSLAIDLFVSAYGAEAGDFALRTVATGGLYIGGGIAPRMLDQLREGTFLRALLDKGRMRGLVERIPVSVIVNPNVGLLGAAARAGRPLPS
jgi:glucokinase